jgi:uncharacterized membrane protein
MLVVMAAGLVLLAAAATPSTARDLPAGAALVLLGLPLLVVPVAARACRRDATLSLAGLAGVQFAVVAICGRAIADEPFLDLLAHPLAWLMVLAAVLGQACLSSALARGTATSTVASMDAVSMVLTSVVGIVALGDRIVPGHEWSVGFGLVLVLGSVLLLGSASPVAVREAV